MQADEVCAMREAGAVEVAAGWRPCIDACLMVDFGCHGLNACCDCESELPIGSCGGPVSELRTGVSASAVWKADGSDEDYGAAGLIDPALVAESGSACDSESVSGSGSDCGSGHLARQTEIACSRVDEREAEAESAARSVQPGAVVVPLWLTVGQ